MKDVHTVIVTHSHPDHFGGAGILRHRVGAEVVTHRAFRTWLDPDEGDDAGPDESTDGRRASRRPRPDQRGTSPWQREMPWRAGQFRPPMKRRLAYGLGKTLGKRWMRAPEPSRRVDDGNVLTFAGREWQAVHTPGHTEDHLCLWSESTTASCSPATTCCPPSRPHISGLHAGHDPLDEFFTSLDRMAELQGATLALPAHGHPFTDLTGRCAEIRDHHHERLDTLREAARSLGEASVVELSKHLFKQRSWGPMAESETYAHLEHLRRAGEMVSRRVDEDLHFQLVRADRVGLTQPGAPAPWSRPRRRPGPTGRSRPRRRPPRPPGRLPSSMGAGCSSDTRSGARRSGRSASACSTGSQETALLTWSIMSKSVNRSGNGRSPCPPAAGVVVQAGPHLPAPGGLGVEGLEPVGQAGRPALLARGAPTARRPRPGPDRRRPRCARGARPSGRRCPSTRCVTSTCWRNTGNSGTSISTRRTTHGSSGREAGVGGVLVAHVLQHPGGGIEAQAALR